MVHFSFNVGSLVQIMIDRDGRRPGSEQYDFLKADLSSVNRTETPWVVLMGHRPMYYYIRDGVETGTLEMLESLRTAWSGPMLRGHVLNLLATAPIRA